MATCSHPDCDRPVKCRRLCQPHYRRLLDALKADKCVHHGCGRAVRASGLCLAHYKQLRRNGKTADLARCGRLPVGDVRKWKDGEWIKSPGHRLSRWGFVKLPRFIADRVVRIGPGDRVVMRDGIPYIMPWRREIRECCRCGRAVVRPTRSLAKRSFCTKCAALGVGRKFDVLIVLQLRLDIATGRMTQAEAAKSLGISKQSMWGIIHGRTWRRVPVFHKGGSLDEFIVACAGFRAREVERRKRGGGVANSANHSRAVAVR